VDAERTEQELSALEEVAASLVDERTAFPSLIMSDGPLIAWQLVGELERSTVGRQKIQRWVSLVRAIGETGVPLVGYTSLPYSRDLVRLLEWYLSPSSPRTDCSVLATQDSPEIALVDADLVAATVPENCRTTLFTTAPYAGEREEFRRSFFYLVTAWEVGRVDLFAADRVANESIDCIAAIVVDQIIKGRGYPVVLAEAHEQAVIKTPDREFFNAVAQAWLQERAIPIQPSQKSFKKRTIGL
jgi:hypothetical protein